MPVNSSSNSSLNLEIFHCADSKASTSVNVFLITKSVLLLPFSILILYLGHRRWRRQRSFAKVSHSDIFTYHLAAMELLGVFGTLFYFCGYSPGLRSSAVIVVGFCLSGVCFCGETLFHILTCVERYLAVVQPVTYLRLKDAGGVRIRNISLGCVWLLCLGWSCEIALYFPKLPILEFSCLFMFACIVCSFCSLSVLRVLIRPGPGEVGGNRERVDQSKQRAFYTMMAIMGVLWLWFAGYIVCFSLDASPLLPHSDKCVVLLSGVWCDLPSSLVLPLLFLYRAGKRSFCRSTAD